MRHSDIYEICSESCDGLDEHLSEATEKKLYSELLDAEPLIKWLHPNRCDRYKLKSTIDLHVSQFDDYTIKVLGNELFSVNKGIYTEDINITIKRFYSPPTTLAGLLKHSFRAAILEFPKVFLTALRIFHQKGDTLVEVFNRTNDSLYRFIINNSTQRANFLDKYVSYNKAPKQYKNTYCGELIDLLQRD